MTDDEDEVATDNSSPAEGIPANIVKDALQVSSEANTRPQSGGDVIVTSAASGDINFYYDAADVERRKSIFRLNRGTTAVDDTSD